MVSSVVLPSMLPEGSSTFSRSRAFFPDLHAADVADGLQLLLDREVGDLAQLEQRALVALDRDHEDRRGVGVGLAHRRGVAVAGQVALGARDLVAHVVGGGLEVDRELELHGDAALSLLADARHRADARDAVDVLLEGFGDLVLDHVGIGSGVGARHGDDRVVDAGVFAHAEVAVPDESEKQDDDRQHRGHHGPPDAQFGDVHASAGFILRRRVSRAGLRAAEGFPR